MPWPPETKDLGYKYVILIIYYLVILDIFDFYLHINVGNIKRVLLNKSANFYRIDHKIADIGIGIGFVP